MKKIITAFVFCFLCGECFSQAGEWVWIKGDSIPYPTANYGVQGVPSPTNNPPGLYEPCEWTDLNGNFWMFGGINSNNGVTNDLWKYDRITNEWTWMKGSAIYNDPGNYGLLGVSSPANNPPARGEGVVSWVDMQGNLWLFGGIVNYPQNDLWKYNIATNEWTWMKGPSTFNDPGVYGTQGVAAPANNPPARWEISASWTDNAGDLWLFGGAAVIGTFNDLWRYNIISDEWTWMKGDSTKNSNATYGIQGIENSANTPGSRMVYSHWKDTAGNFWMFGGANISGAYNDLWRYSTSTDNWTWMSGDSLPNGTFLYGIKCTSTASNIPRGHYENRSAWTDQNGDFWFFGGFGYTGIRQNDLWKYCVAANSWVWESGDSTLNPPGYWGVQGVASPANKPDGRGGPVGWTDHNGHLYIFGGWGINGDYNDIWKYTIDTTCGVCPSSTDIEENNLTNQLLVFPNPTNSSLTISFSSSEKQTVELRIYNTLGKQIYVEKEEITKGKFEKEINVEKWSEGIYFLQVKMREGNLSRKVIVSHP